MTHTATPPTPVIRHVRGDTFNRLVTLRTNGDAVSLAGAAVGCQARTTAGVVVQTFAVEFVNAAGGTFRIKAPHTDTVAWPLGVHELDIEITQDGTHRSIPLVRLNVLKDVTQP